MFSFLRKNNIDGEWRTVAELKVGQSIAVPKDGVLNAHRAGEIDSREWIGDSDVIWDEIESIELVGTEQVWDIEVEGTHNFIGNNIFAHNTYITGNIGAGTSTPYAKLSAAGDNTNTTLIGADAVSGFTGNLMELKTASTTLFSVAGGGFGTTTVSGLNISGSATSTSNVGLNITTGCYAINGTCQTGYTDSLVNAYIHASTTIPKVYTNNSWAGTNTFANTSTFNGAVALGGRAINSLLATDASGNLVATSTYPLYVGYITATTTTASILPYASTTGISTNGLTINTSANGPLQANNGVVSATTSVGVLYGGTGATNYSNNTIISFDGTRFVSTSTPTFGYFNATSTNATSTISTGGFTVGTSKFVVQQSSGNVGIGTTTPSGNLEVYGVTPTIKLANSGAAKDTIVMQAAPGGADTSKISAYDFVSGAGKTLHLQTDNNNLVIGENGGNVGIGTTTPQAKLSLATDSSTNIQIGSFLSGYGAIGFQNTLSASNYAFAGSAAETLINTPSGAAVKFRVNNADKVIIDSSGNVGIGTTAPKEKLHVAGGIVTTDGLRGNVYYSGGWKYLSTGAYGQAISFNPTDGNMYFANTAVTGTADAAATLVNTMVIDKSGNVGIGTTTPYSKLSVWGGSTGNIFEAVTSASTTALSVSATGFSTTTLSGLNINGSATSTSNVGFNITTGCYAVNGTCVGGISSLTGNNLTKGYFLVGNDAGLSQATSSVFISSVGNFGVGTVAPSALLSLQGAGTAKDLFSIASTTNGISVITINQWGGFIQKIASTSAMSIQMASGTPVFEVDTTSSNVNAGMDITAATGQTANLLNLYSSGGTFLSGFTASGGLWMNLASTTALNMYDGSGNSAFVVDSTNKNVGIGTSTLAYALTVQGNQAANYIARIDNSDTGTDADGLLITLGVANASRTTSNYFVGFATGDKTVAGKIQGGASAVAYTTTAADLAEYFRISNLGDKPEAGEIVIIDGTKNKSVLKSGASGNVEPLGIVSTNPGFIGNGPICFAGDDNCDKNYAEYNSLVSISGQVPVKVSFENGPIVAGDYLTFSTTTPGVAVKMVESGYIVGVAISEATTTDMFGTPQKPMVNVFIKNGWREIESTKTFVSTDGSSQMQVPGKWFGLFEFLKQIGIEIGNGFIKIASLITEKIIANKVETKELCIDGVCVNKEQLAALLLNSGIPQTSTTTPSSSSSSGSSSTTTSTSATSTSTPPATVSTSTPATSISISTSTPSAVAPTEPATTTTSTTAPAPTSGPVSTTAPTSNPVVESGLVAPVTVVDLPTIAPVVETAPAPVSAPAPAPAPAPTTVTATEILPVQ